MKIFTMFKVFKIHTITTKALTKHKSREIMTAWTGSNCNVLVIAVFSCMWMNFMQMWVQTHYFPLFYIFLLVFSWRVFRTSSYTAHFLLYQHVQLYKSQVNSELQPAVCSSRGAPVILTTGSDGLTGPDDFTNWPAHCCRHCGQIFVFWDTGQTAESDVLAGTYRRRWSAGGFEKNLTFKKLSWLKTQQMTWWIRCSLNLQ